MTDLELVSDDDLLDELLNRFDHACFVGMRVSIPADYHGYTRRHKGNSHTCVGLLQELSSGILDDFHERQIVDDEDE
jgi:hypothetical protein